MDNEYLKEILRSYKSNKVSENETIKVINQIIRDAKKEVIKDILCNLQHYKKLL